MAATRFRLAAWILGLLLGLVGVRPALAGEVQVAVAANFAEPVKAIAVRFEQATRHHAAISLGASGQFYAQIAHGAPFEVFLSADAERPAKAEAEGFAVKGTRFTYAVGRLVLYSRTPGLVDDQGQVLERGRFEKLAIADPAAAPYGAAAVQTLTALKLYDRLKPRIVTGASIGQAYDFVHTGAAELGFLALSQVIADPAGSRWIVPERLHAPILQDAVLLRAGEANPAARAFLAFLKGPEAKAIIARYGYGDR